MENIWERPRAFSSNVDIGRGRIAVSILEACIVDGARSIPLTNRELELVVALASHRKPCSADFLADLLYGDDVCGKPSNAIKVHIHRIRRRVSNLLIVSGPRGYSLADDVVVDLDAYEERVRFARGRFDELSIAELEALGDIASRLLARRPHATHRWAWFCPVEARLSNAGLDLWLEVTDKLLRQRRYQMVTDLAKTLPAAAAICEAACEVVVRAYLALGRFSDAVETFRRYGNALQAELQIGPSPAIRAMLHEAQASLEVRAPREALGIVAECRTVKSSTRERTPYFESIERT